MDVIQDAALAIRAFQARHEKTDLGERYLGLYGVLQAIHLQQDGIKRLYGAARGKDWHITQAMKEVRDLRDRVAGHPAPPPKGTKKRATFLNHRSLEGRPLQILKIGDDGKNEWVDIALPSLVSAHLEDVATELCSLADDLIKAERQLRAIIMKNGPLVDLLHPSWGYLIGKLWEAAWADSTTLDDRSGLGQASVGNLLTILSAVSEGLQARGLPPLDPWHRDLLAQALERMKSLLRSANDAHNVRLDVAAFTSLIEREFKYIHELLMNQDKALGEPI